MNNVKLYIQDNLIELDDNVKINITKSFSDLTDPVAVKNSSSRTVKVPSTPNNDLVFEHIWRLDQVYWQFDPSKRANFGLYVNGALFESGYIKLNTIDYSNLKDDKPDWYNITLFGGLGDYFYQLSEKDINEIYYFNNLRHEVSRTSVYNSFINSSAFAYNDWMKYAMVYEGFYDNFESDRVYVRQEGGPGSEPVFLDLAGNRDQCQRRELRSYYQRPCLKMGYFIQRLLLGTTYGVDIDNTFFTDSNPYFDKTYLVCQQYNTANNEVRSYTMVEYKDMVRSGTMMLEMLLSYCLPFGLIFKKDLITNRIKVQTRETHFKNYSIVDWTNKLDYSKTYKKTPIPFDYRYAVLKWKDSSSFYAEYFREKYNREYAQVRLNTGWEFDDNTKNLFENNILYNCVESFEFDSYFGRWLQFGSGVASSNNLFGKLLALFDKSNRDRENNTDRFTMAIYDGVKDTDGDGTIGLDTFYITDDDTVLSSRDIYCWEYNQDNVEPQFDNENRHYPVYRQESNQIPSFVRRTKTHSLDFAVPAESYDERDIYDPNSTIYNRYWKYYLEERLNNQNNILTAYFYLTNEEVQLWDFTKFVKIHDTLWFVNKIQDFDVVGESSTKCELIRVNDIDRYINFVDYSMSISPGGSTFRYVGGTGTTYVTSNLPPTATTSVNWITVDSIDWNGTNYTTKFTVAENPFTSTRTGYIYFTNGRNTVVYQVTQLGYPYVTVTPTSQTTNQTAKTVTFTVTSNYPVNIEE